MELTDAGPFGVRLDGVETWLWRGDGPGGRGAVVLGPDGRPARFASPAAAVAACAPPVDVTPEGEPDVLPALDVAVTTDWVAGRLVAVPGEECLDLLDLADDVARAMGLAWEAFPGREGWRVNTLLIGLAVPWLTGGERVVWRAHDLRWLRARVPAAVALLRGALQ